MATAVLLPRDCFSPVRNKQQNGLEGVAHHRPESSARSRRGIHHQDLVSRYGSSSRKFDPVIVTVDDSPHSFGQSSRPNRATMRKGNEGKRSKTRNSKVVTKSQPEIPTYTILQRPKSNEPMDLNILKLMGKVETDGSLGSLEIFAKKVDFSSGSEKENSKRPVILEKRNQIVSSDTEGCPKAKKEVIDLKTDKSKHVKGGHNTKSKFCWDVKTKPANVKTYGVTERAYQTVSGNPPIQETNGGTVHKEVFVKKDENLNIGNIVSNEDASASGPLLLRRAFTDPQSIQCLATEMTKFEDNEAKYGSQRDITSNESYNEKWAGPAYSSSPAPSSLPFPKFTLSNMKVSSHRHITNHRNSPLEPLSQVNKEPSGIGSSVHLLPDPVQLGSYDAVLATRSLRRLLNLDP